MTRGTFIGETPEGVRVYAKMRADFVDELNDPERMLQTVDHRTVRAGDVPFVAITWDYGTRRELNAGNGSGGAGIDPQTVDELPEGARTRARRLVELSDRWHLNTMVAGCIHQPEAWTCTRGRLVDALGVISEGCGTLNGWEELRRVHGPHPYPKRGDACMVCDRNRWDEPTDRCAVSGYRYGTSWLAEVPPPEVLAELRELLGVSAAA